MVSGVDFTDVSAGKCGVTLKSSAQKQLGEGTATAELSNSLRVRNNLLGKAWK